MSLNSSWETIWTIHEMGMKEFCASIISKKICIMDEMFHGMGITEYDILKIISHFVPASKN
jgi:hypothetical protein